ncbi:redox-active disulfide protein 2 [Halalkaliarchaeum desulfuricum]|uniref:Redox-active disulfide protein 2 n=1 Tax=Halalkaliarchaeum desulfuricum TaxID=2055893 RepID=A0A343TG51_9EURY|nr:MTH895/ArsE family thioredoxin-like protein [Halalkaliarchaeum desulfuricum]AUX08073.1 redox-active disulfide protein 2 [Halalkaliarchaeum desulfuricum]
MKIEVIGPGCPRCKKTEQHVILALDRLDDDVDADVEKIDKQMEIIDRGVMHTPAVAVDEEIEIEGEIPEVEELVELFRAT